MDIPSTDSFTIQEIEAMYKQYIKKIHVDYSVEQNQGYLVILWLVIDVVCTRLFKLPFNGRYVQSQLKYMSKYKILLVELGERNYREDGNGASWPVEYRLLIMAIVHAAIFALIQLLVSKIGAREDEQTIYQVQNLVDDFLLNTRSKPEVLRRVEEVTSDKFVPPDSTPQSSGGDGFVSLLSGFASFLPNLLGGIGGGGGGSAPSPQVKRPTPFAARAKSKGTV